MAERTRRDLLASLFGAARSSVRPARRIDPATAPRPPGALVPDEAFVEACTGCGDCVPVCPADAIVMVETGPEEKLPAVHPSLRACVLCTELPCITACADGALVDPGGPERVRMGVGRVDPRRCVTFKGEHCDRCFKACPYPHQAIMMIGGRPLVGSGACTGCGLCEQACPEEPKAIVVVAERLLVPGMRIPKDEIHNGPHS